MSDKLDSALVLDNHRAWHHYTVYDAKNNVIGEIRHLGGSPCRCERQRAPSLGMGGTGPSTTLQPWRLAMIQPGEIREGDVIYTDTQAFIVEEVGNFPEIKARSEISNRLKLFTANGLWSPEIGVFHPDPNLRDER